MILDGTYIQAARRKGKYHGPTPWNDQTLAILKARWEEGVSASEIAAEIGTLGYSITRNSVIGKAHRMNYKQPPKGFSPKAPRNQPRKRIVVPATHEHASKWSKKKTKLPTFIETKKLDPNNTGVSIMALRKNMCRAIVRDGTFNTLATYCGEKTLGGSFCPGHAELFYVPMELRRNTRWR